MSACMCWRHIRFSPWCLWGVYRVCCCGSWAVDPPLPSPLPGACPQSLHHLPLSSLCLRLHLQLHPPQLPPPVSCPFKLNSVWFFFFQYQYSIQAFCYSSFCYCWCYVLNIQLKQFPLCKCQLHMLRSIACPFITLMGVSPLLSACVYTKPAWVSI